MELVHHIYHARSDTSSRDRATMTTRSRQPYELSFTIFPITILERERVQLQDVGRSGFVRIYAELYTIQRAIDQAFEYLILCNQSTCSQKSRGESTLTSHVSNLSTPFVFPGARTIKGRPLCASTFAKCAISFSLLGNDEQASVCSYERRASVRILEGDRISKQVLGKRSL